MEPRKATLPRLLYAKIPFSVSLTFLTYTFFQVLYIGMLCLVTNLKVMSFLPIQQAAKCHQYNLRCLTTTILSYISQPIYRDNFLSLTLNLNEECNI